MKASTSFIKFKVVFLYVSFCSWIKYYYIFIFSFIVIFSKSASFIGLNEALSVHLVHFIQRTQETQWLKITQRFKSIKHLILYPHLFSLNRLILHFYKKSHIISDCQYKCTFNYKKCIWGPSKKMRKVSVKGIKEQKL